MNTMTQDSSTGLWNNKNRKIFFWSILALAVILRCIRFATVPDGINHRRILDGSANRVCICGLHDADDRTVVVEQLRAGDMFTPQTGVGAFAGARFAEEQHGPAVQADDRRMDGYGLPRHGGDVEHRP